MADDVVDAFFENQKDLTANVCAESNVVLRVENSNMAPIGTRKKTPITTNTTTRKTCSLSRRERFTRRPGEALST